MLSNENIYFDAEQLVLSALLMEKNALLRIFDRIKPDMFFTPVHKEIYSSIISLSSENAPIDLLTVSNALKNNSEFIKAGGVSNLAEISNRLTSSYNLEDHARIVYDGWLCRRIFLIASQLSHDARIGECSGEDLLLQAKQQLQELEQEVPLFNAIKDAAIVIQNAKEAGLQRVEQYRLGISCTGITTALPDLDQMLFGWQKGELIVLAARPSIGKTALALHFTKAAIEAGKHTLIFSMEMSAEKLGDRLIVGASNIDPDHWRSGGCTLYDLEAIEGACNKLSNQNFYIDDATQRSFNQIRSSALRMQQRGQCDLIVIDYLQLAEMKGDNKNLNRQDLVSTASADAKRLARDLNVPVILLSQLNRGLEQRPGKRPELADLRDSGAIEQDADVVVLIHRPEFYGIYEDRSGTSTRGRGELIVAKHRNGGTGTVYFNYNKSLTRIQ